MTSQAIHKSTEVLLDLLKQAQAYMIPASCLLFDSWFSFPIVIRKVLEQQLHTICMLKQLPTVKYEYQGQQLNLNKLYGAVKEKRGRAKILASVIVGMGKISNGEQFLIQEVIQRCKLLFWVFFCNLCYSC